MWAPDDTTGKRGPDLGHRDQISCILLPCDISKKKLSGKTTKNKFKKTPVPALLKTNSRVTALFCLWLNGVQSIAVYTINLVNFIRGVCINTVRTCVLT